MIKDRKLDASAVYGLQVLFATGVMFSALLGACMYSPEAPDPVERVSFVAISEGDTLPGIVSLERVLSGLCSLDTTALFAPSVPLAGVEYVYLYHQPSNSRSDTMFADGAFTVVPYELLTQIFGGLDWCDESLVQGDTVLISGLSFLATVGSGWWIFVETAFNDDPYGLQLSTTN